MNQNVQRISWDECSVCPIEQVSILQFDDEVSPRSQTSDNEYAEVAPSVVIMNRNVIKIDVEDEQPEVDFWNFSLICYIIGGNPPLIVMNGYIRRLWSNKGVDSHRS